MDSTDNRLAYILLTLCSTPAISSGTLAEKLRVSERTVSNDVKQLEGELKGCATIRSNQGKYALHVFDAERFRTVRAGILAEESGFNSVSGRMDYIFSRLARSQVPLLTDELAYEMNMGRSTRRRFEKCLTVMLDRFLTGHPIGELSPAFYRLTIRPEFEAVNALMERIGGFLHTDIPVEEQLFTLLPVMGMRTPADGSEMRSIRLDPAMGPLQDKIFRRILLEMDLRIEAPELREEFLYHLMFMLNRLRFRVRLKNPMATELREKYPLAWRMASSLIAQGQADREVRTIFLMGLPEDAGRDALLVRVYEEIISITRDGALLDEIGKADSFQLS